MERNKRNAWLIVHTSFQPSKQLLDFISDKFEIQKPHHHKKLEEFKIPDENDLIVIYFELGDDKASKLEENFKNINRYIESKGKNFKHKIGLVIIPKDLKIESRLTEELLIIRETTFPEGGKIAKKLNTYDIDPDEQLYFNYRFKNEGTNPRKPNDKNKFEDCKMSERLLDALEKEEKKKTTVPKFFALILFDKDITFFHNSFVNGLKNDEIDVKQDSLVTFTGENVKDGTKIIAVIHQYGRLNETQEIKMKLLAENFGSKRVFLVFVHQDIVKIQKGIMLNDKEDQTIGYCTCPFTVEKDYNGKNPKHILNKSSFVDVVRKLNSFLEQA